jgi:small subunit ribosomal protein S15
MPTSVKKVANTKVKTEQKSKDTGSSSVQVELLTNRISELTKHVKLNKHDFMSRRGLLQLVGQRKRLLKYIARKDSDQYLTVVKKLGLRH